LGCHVDILKHFFKVKDLAVCQVTVYPRPTPPENPLQKKCHIFNKKNVLGQRIKHTKSEMALSELGVGTGT